MNHAEAILRAAAALVAKGHRELARKDIRDELGLTQSEWMSGYTAIFQGMRDDHPGRAPQVAKKFQGVFHQIDRGRYALTELGQRAARALSPAVDGSKSKVREGHSGRVQLRGQGGLRQVVIYPGEDGYWVAECPSLPGCVSQGRTKKDAIANVREAIHAYVAALVYDDLPVPEEKFEAVPIAV
jgi:predicted RNase H-like HicB family nuclease